MSGYFSTFYKIEETRLESPYASTDAITFDLRQAFVALFLDDTNAISKVCRFLKRKEKKKRRKIKLQPFLKG